MIRYTARVPRRLASYLLRETVGMYALGVAAFCLLLSIDFLSVWAKFLIEQNAPATKVGQLMLFKLPWFLHLSLPIAVVFAVLLATGRLAKDSELKAAYAMGVPPLRLLAPLVAFGLLISALTIANNGYVEPIAERAYRKVVDSFFYTRPPAEVQTDVSFVIDDVGIFFAGRLRADEEDRDRAFLSGILVFQQDGTVLTAQRGVWDSRTQRWTLEEIERVRPGQTPEVLDTLTLPFAVDADPEVTLARSETLTLTALARQLSSVREAGGNTRPLAFALHRQLADAFAAAVFVLIAGTLGLHLRNRSAGFGWTIALLVVFWAVWTLSGNLFETGVLTPVMAAWFTPALIGTGGVALAIWRLRT